MDAVLGLSMTPTSVGLVLVEGHEGDGVTMERDAVEIRNSDEAAAAILASEALAATRGLRLKSIGVTWSEDVGAEASMLMKTLSESGFDNIVPVALPAATEAMAHRIADGLGYRTTAVCAIEPDTVIAMILRSADTTGGIAHVGTTDSVGHVGTTDSAVHTAFNHSIDSDDSLISWLSAVFTRADWQPEALVVVGSAGDFGEVAELLEDALSVPVFSPAEAELALARGAALASTSKAHTTEFVAPEPYAIFGLVPEAELTASGRHRRTQRKPSWFARSGPALPLAMLITGSATFVASVSIAVTMQFTADRHAQPAPAAVTQHAPVAEPAAPPVAPVAPSPTYVAVHPAPETVDPPQPDPSVEQAPTAEQTPIVDQAQTDAEPPAAAAPTQTPVEAAPPADIPPADSSEQPHRTLRSRLMDRLRGVPDTDPADPAPASDVPQPAPPAP